MFWMDFHVGFVPIYNRITIVVEVLREKEIEIEIGNVIVIGTGMDFRNCYVMFLS